MKPLREEGGRERKDEVVPVTFGFNGEDTKAVDTDRIIDCWGSRGASEEDVRGLAMGTGAMAASSVN